MACAGGAETASLLAEMSWFDSDSSPFPCATDDTPYNRGDVTLHFVVVRNNGA
jgi:hypothetical protein